VRAIFEKAKASNRVLNDEEIEAVVRDSPAGAEERAVAMSGFARSAWETAQARKRGRPRPLAYSPYRTRTVR
jgi:hypothetical protein